MRKVKTMAETRLISLSDGTCMGNTLFIFKTNAPAERLRDLEKQCCQIYVNGEDEEDVPIWSCVLQEEGYVFSYVDEHGHVTAYGTSDEWIREKYPQIAEHYEIENQP